VFDKVLPVQAWESMQAEHSQLKQRTLVLEDHHRVSQDQHRATQGKYASLCQTLVTLTVEHKAGGKTSGTAVAAGSKRSRPTCSANEDVGTSMLLLLRQFGAMMCDGGAAISVPSAGLVLICGSIISKKPLVQAILQAAHRSGLRFVDVEGEGWLLHATIVHFAQLLCRDVVKVLWNFSATKDHEKDHIARPWQPEIRVLNTLLLHFEKTLNSRSAEANQDMVSVLAIFKEKLEVEVVRKLCFLLRV
jgi:hypothetical protein